MHKTPRSKLFDLLKALAAQFIFFHHMSLYGPFALALEQAGETYLPGLLPWLSSYGRYAVQVFLVISGALALQSLQRGTEQASILRHLGQSFVKRYLRLVNPYIVILVFTLLLTAWARPWIVGDMLPAEQSWPSLLGAVLAHALLLQGVLGIDSLSTGVWYVAIDLQLFALFCVSFALAVIFQSKHATGKSPFSILACVLLTGVAASAYYFNARPEWDSWGSYFFAAYGLGALATLRGTGRWQHLFWWLGLATVASALLWNWRLPLAIAAFTAGIIWAEGAYAVKKAQSEWHSGNQGLNDPSEHRRSTPTRESADFWAQLAKESYAFFLLNFPVLILVNVAFIGLNVSAQDHGFVMLLSFCAWVTCLTSAHYFQNCLDKLLS